MRLQERSQLLLVEPARPRVSLTGPEGAERTRVLSDWLDCGNRKVPLLKVFMWVSACGACGRRREREVATGEVHTAEAAATRAGRRESEVRIVRFEVRGSRLGAGRRSCVQIDADGMDAVPTRWTGKAVLKQLWLCSVLV